ncbi:TrbI F-type domain-containing protein [Candidatus Pantoea soli]|uniref:Type-F conjugative transfer system protein TrbI n=1 Tax=Candidatus Pantoea soli TaxID=3098669 RepID=A0A518XJA4_9GAMM|nr:TrbI F-type domain-containing protein [Pantoea soli]QDY44265.1 type-F conjugative transfer system protein TrbI [Pantoea soli]
MDLKQSAACIAASILISVGACAAAWSLWLKPPALVTFDMKGTTNALIRQTAKLDLTDDQRKALLTRFDRSVTTATAEYASEHGAAILVSPAVVTGLPDATPEIQARLAELMKAGNPQQ